MSRPASCRQLVKLCTTGSISAGISGSNPWIICSIKRWATLQPSLICLWAALMRGSTSVQPKFIFGERPLSLRISGVNEHLNWLLNHQVAVYPSAASYTHQQSALPGRPKSRALHTMPPAAERTRLGPHYAPLSGGGKMKVCKEHPKGR